MLKQIYNNDDNDIPLGTIAFMRSSTVDAWAIWLFYEVFGCTFACAFNALKLYTFSCNHWDEALLRILR